MISSDASVEKLLISVTSDTAGYPIGARGVLDYRCYITIIARIYPSIILIQNNYTKEIFYVIKGRSKATTGRFIRRDNGLAA